MQQSQIALNKIISESWVLKNLAGSEITNKKVFNQEFEDKKQFLKMLWYTDIEDIFPRRLDHKEFDSFLSKIYQFSGGNNDQVINWFISKLFNDDPKPPKQ